MISEKLKNKLLQTGCFLDNSYLQFYVQLICSNLPTLRKKGITQSHHIIPQAYFQLHHLPVDNSSENVINLNYIDHITAHYYLAMCTQEEELRTLCVYAFKLMSGGKNIQALLTDAQAMNQIQDMYEQIHLLKIQYKDEVISREQLSVIHSNTVWINNGVINKKVKQSSLNEYVAFGWTTGRLSQNPATQKSMQKVRSQNGKKIAGRVWMHKELKETRVPLEEVESLILEGWLRGRSPQAEQRLKEGHAKLRGRISPTKGRKLPTVSEKMKGNTRTLNKIFINNGVCNKRVLRGTEGMWLNQGWKLGRLPRNSKKAV